MVTVSPQPQTGVRIRHRRVIPSIPAPRDSRHEHVAAAVHRDASHTVAYIRRPVVAVSPERHAALGARRSRAENQQTTGDARHGQECPW